jgi:hypothetical protein
LEVDVEVEVHRQVSVVIRFHHRYHRISQLRMMRVNLSTPEAARTFKVIYIIYEKVDVVVGWAE